MEPGSHSDGHAEFAAVMGRMSNQLVHCAETGRDAPAVCGPLLELPGRNQLIANIPMDFATRRDDRLSEIEDETIEQAMKGERAEPLGQSRRTLHVEEQEYPRFHAGRVIAAGDEVKQHVLAEQAVHVLDEGEHERRGEREQHVYALNSPFSGRREHPRSQLESEQDHNEIDAGPDGHVHGKRRAAKRSSERPPQNKGVERRQNAADDRTGHRAASQAIDGEHPPAIPDIAGEAQGESAGAGAEFDDVCGVA